MFFPCVGIPFIHPRHTEFEKDETFETPTVTAVHNEGRVLRIACHGGAFGAHKVMVFEWSSDNLTSEDQFYSIIIFSRQSFPQSFCLKVTRMKWF